MKAIKNIILFYLILTICFSCKNNLEFQKIEYELPYKFNDEIEAKLASDSLPWRFQIAASEYALKGNYKDALRVWDSVFPLKEKQYPSFKIDSINNIYSKKSAVDYIVKEAQKTRVTIINEAHHNSFHRKFTASLLQKLFNYGYRHIGLEALANGEEKDLELNKRKYPIQTSGYYTRDPQFGNLIREALKIGYHVFAYEQTFDENGKEREIIQARNIQKILDEHPNDKVLIHCGFDHALEGKHRSWEKAMAGRLAEFTGINPLTINQTTFSERSNSIYNLPLLKAVQATNSIVLINKEAKPYPYTRRESFTDIAVFHPNTIYINNRPNWLFTEETKKVSIKFEELEIEYPVMILAYEKEEPINKAVPVDIVEVEKDEKECFMALPKGSYEMVVVNKKQAYLFSKKIY